MAGLGDLLAGIGGHGVDRPGLEAYVANSQAMNGLRSAQTEDAIYHAQQMREQAQARDDLEGSLTASGMDPSRAHAISTLAHGSLGAQFKDIVDALGSNQQQGFRGTLGDASQLNTPAQTAAAQGASGHLAGPTALPEAYTTPAGVTPQVGVSPVGEADIANRNATADLHTVQAEAGGYNPHTGAFNGQQLSPELQAAVNNGKLAPNLLNSRTAMIYDQLLKNNPDLDVNAMVTAGALGKNAQFRNRTMSMEALPGVLSHMTQLGKQVGYNDLNFVGKAQQWFKGQNNDPDLTEYMTVRNDALMNLASTMRGVGMSDQAHNAEIEAANPTMSPMALDAWLKGQMSVLQPRLEKQESLLHPKSSNNPGGATPGAAPATPAPAAPVTSAAAPAAPVVPSAPADPLGIRGS